MDLWPVCHELGKQGGRGGLFEDLIEGVDDVDLVILPRVVQ